jgi:Protein kinase domain/AAA ATPase domain
MIDLPSRYEIRQELHVGERSTAWQCWDRQDRELVVIKVAPRGEQGPILEEWQCLQKLTSERVLRPKELGSHYLVLPFLEGPNLKEELAARGAMEFESVLGLASDLLEALDDVHKAGLIHRDLHPGNVLFHAGRWMLLDFDLSEQQRLAAGTIGFVAPEQVGMAEGEVAPRSDLYSLSCVLAYALDPSQKDHQLLRSGDPPSGTPFGLLQFLQRLGARDPKARYQTAVGASLDLKRLQGNPHRAFTLGLEDRAARSAVPSFSGRDLEMGVLRSVWAQAKVGPSRSFWVEAAAGLGKSRLAQTWIGELRSSGCLVVQAYGHPEHPASPVEQWAAQLTSWLPHLPVDLARDARILTEGGGEAVPGLAKNLVLCNLLEHLGPPVLLVVDDAQWMLTETVSFAQTFLSRNRNGLLCVFARPTDVAADLVLGPLTLQDMHSFVTSALGPLPPEVIDRILSLSQGSPLLLEGYLHGLVETKALVLGPAGWTFDAESEVFLGRREATILKRRLNQLSDDSRRTLEAMAVLGRSATVSELTSLSKGLPSLKQVVERHLVREQ